MIDMLNKNSLFHGIVLQLPLPKNFAADFQEIMDSIDKYKDIDCISTPNYNNTIFYNQGISPLKNKVTGQMPTPSSTILNEQSYPCTALAVDQMLQFYGIDCSHKRVVVLGNSYLVGRPISTLFSRKGAFVSVCDLDSPFTKCLIKEADILVSCTGSEIKLGAADVKDGLVLFDVGIRFCPRTRRVKGDVDVSLIKEKLGFYTPVPGGMGPLTVANMIFNLYGSFARIEGERLLFLDN